MSSSAYAFREDFNGSELSGYFAAHNGDVTVSGGVATVVSRLELVKELSQYNHDVFIQVCSKLSGTHHKWGGQILQLAERKSVGTYAECIHYAGNICMVTRMTYDGGWSSQNVAYPGGSGPTDWMVFGVLVPTSGGIEFYIKAGQTAFDPANLPAPASPDSRGSTPRLPSPCVANLVTVRV